MLLVHILFVLFSIDLSPPIRTSRVPSSTPGTSILEVDEAGNQIEIAANGLVFTHLTVPEAEATFANANTTPPDMHPNVSSASAAPEGSVASQVSAILDPLQGDAEEMSKAERGANMLTQRNLPETQASMIELRQKHESAEFLLRASISEAETQKQQNASEAMGAQYLAKDTGLEANHKWSIPTINPMTLASQFVNRKIDQEVSRTVVPPALKGLAVAEKTIDAALYADDFLDFAIRAGYIRADADLVSKELMQAAEHDGVRLTSEDVQRAVEELAAIKDLWETFRLPEIDARRALRAVPGYERMPVEQALARAKQILEKQAGDREDARAKRANRRQIWKTYCLQKAREEFGNTLIGETVPGGRDYLEWKIDMIFKTAGSSLPDYSTDVSDAIRTSSVAEKVMGRARLDPVPQVEDIDA